MAQVLGPLPSKWEIQMELQVLSFGQAQTLHDSHLESEPEEENISVCLSLLHSAF